MSRTTAYWGANLRLSARLLAIWFVVTFVVAYWARDLDMVLFGWPFSFWMAAQGALIVYCVIVIVYARRLARLDHQHGTAGDAPEDAAGHAPSTH